ncbi:MAG: hypothetical protein U1E17_03120 [Geminicoccaceae bacterium]
MAARRVSLSYLVTAVVLSLGAAAATFHLKHEVRDLERQLAAVEAETARERWAVQGAVADLAYLTRPDRLVMQAQQLGLVPARGNRIVTAGQLLTQQQIQLAGTAPRPAVLPSGVAVSLRAKPLPTPLVTLASGGY